MKNVFFAGLAALTLSFGALPAYAGAPEVDPAKDEGKQEEQNQQDQKDQDQPNQEEQNQQDQGLQARRGRGARVVCYSRNLEGRVFQAWGVDAVNTQARALNQCYVRSFGLLKGTCIPAGCRR